ncbi:MAG: apolipoprotein N-acyltransferase [Gemmatimonadota bacterium]
MTLLTRSETSRLGLAGVLLALAFPPLPFGLLSLVALVPLLQVLDADPRPGFRRGFTRGAFFGSAFYLLLLFWLWDLVRFTPLIAPTWLLSSLYLGALVGLAVGAAQWVRARTGRSPALLLPFAWIGLEKLLQYGDLRFTWGVLADTLTPYPLLLQTAELWGALGISFLIVLVNGLAYAAWRSSERSPWRRAPALGLVALSVAVLAYGAARWSVLPGPGEGGGAVVAGGAVSEPARPGGGLTGGNVVRDPAEDLGPLIAPAVAAPAPPPAPGSVRVAVIQPDIPQAVRDQRENEGYERSRLLELSRRALQLDPDLVVWPETAASWLRYDPAYLAELVALCCGSGATAPFLVGALDALEPGTAGQRIFNAAFLVDEAGEIAGVYRKALLVPMTEQVPYSGLLGFLKPDVWSGSFSAGGSFTPLEFRADAPGEAGSVRVGVPICYEIIFAHAIREFRRRGARLIVTITNDAWFGRTPAPYQHASQLRLRAIESRMAIARAANTGISGFVSPRGDVIAATDIFEPAYLVADLPLAGGVTPYVRWGDWILPVSWLGLALASGLARRRAGATRSRGPTEPQRVTSARPDPALVDSPGEDDR